MFLRNPEPQGKQVSYRKEVVPCTVFSKIFVKGHILLGELVQVFQSEVLSLFFADPQPVVGKIDIPARTFPVARFQITVVIARSSEKPLGIKDF